MPERARGSNVAAGVGVGLLLLVSIFFLVYEPSEPEYRQSETERYAQQTLADDQTSRAPLIGSGKTLPSHPEPDRKEWREEQGLKAQWHQADFARKAVFLAFLSIVVTGAGLLLVWQTLETNRAATNVAKESSQRSLRAYVLFNGGKIIFTKDDPPKYSVDLDITNEGDTPAWNLTHSINSKVGVRSLGRYDFVYSLTKRSESLDLGSGGELPHRKDEFLLTAAQVEDLKHGTQHIWVWGRLWYRDVYQLWSQNLFRAVTDEPFTGKELPLRIIWMTSMEEISKEDAAKERTETVTDDYQEDDDPEPAA